ncbi:hypothetical protein EJB05_30395, partial [Eragrostis curvula]
MEANSEKVVAARKLADAYSKTLLNPFPGGLLYQELDSNAIKLTGASPNDGSVDAPLSFLPQSDQLELLDCCNGLVLCKYGSSSTPDIYHYVVCNPVTRQWTALPETHPEPKEFQYLPKLAFNPSWSPNFYVFNFQQICSPGPGANGVSAVRIFSSENWSWFVDDQWTPKNDINVTSRPHFFLHGVLYVHTADDRLLEMKDFHQTEQTNHRFIELPGYRPSCPYDDFLYGCLGQSSGILQYAKPEIDGCKIQVWGLEQRGWDLKHSLNISAAFGRHTFVQYDIEGFLCCDYEIQIVDPEREVIFLHDCIENKLLSYSMSTGMLTKIQDGFNRYMSYVPWSEMIRVESVAADEGTSED